MDKQALGFVQLGAVPAGRRLAPVRIGAFLVGYLSIIGAVLSLVVAALLMPTVPTRIAVPTIVRVDAGSSSSRIAKVLVEHGILKHPTPFILASRLLGVDARIQAGEYRLSPGMNLLQVLHELTYGRVITRKITIPEGYTLEQIAYVLAKNGLVDRDRFLMLATDQGKVFGSHQPVLKPTLSLEGYLFPDTYYFVPGQQEEEIIKRMVGRFVDRVILGLHDELKETHLSIHEVITLASIIEKEAVKNEERPVIAGVFYNRLRRGRPLQSDPTVQYALGYRGRLSRRHLAVESPYNTYRWGGLPPGPIGSPGIASIQAALRPASVEYLYFVAKGDGTHAFSKTFEEHKAARRKFGY